MDHPRFELREKIGEGAMGLVYRAHDRETGLDVALKTLRNSTAEDLRRLKAEFRSLADVVHPNLVRLFDLDTTVSPAFFTMQLVDGQHFDRFARRGTDTGHARIDYDLLADALWQLALGLQALHRTGRHHRDIKPSNVLVDASGHSVLLDFGLVRSAHERDDAMSAGFAGTAAYMAPEQAWGREETPVADWFSVGVMLYECLTGKLPFGGTGAMFETRPPPRPSSLVPETPAALDDLTMRLLELDPKERVSEERLIEVLRRGPGVSVLFPPAEASIVGRRTEIETLLRSFEEATTRDGVAVRVTGTSGIGKTALVHQFLRELAVPATVLRARCRPQETVAFAAVDGVVDELARSLAGQPPDVLDAVAPAHLRALVRAFPVLESVRFRSPPPEETEPSEPAELRRLAFGALRDALARFAARKPVVVWVDDLQWGDTASAPILLDLMRAPGCKGLLLVLSYRSEDTERSPLLGSIEAERGPRIALGPLGDSEARSLATRLLSEARGASFERADEIARESRGSPFFVAAIARSVAARSNDPAAARDAVVTVETVVEEHLGRLAPDGRRLLEIVAVAGGSILRSAALEAADLGAQGRLLLSSLEHEYLVRIRDRGGDPAVEVYHDRIREGVLHGLEMNTRQARHHSLATALEKNAASDPESLVYHFEGAGVLDSAGLHAIAAADRAAALLAFERAAELYRKAIAWAPNDPTTVRSLQSRRADALVDAGRCAEAAPLYLRAADGAPRPEALELRRRAVEQLLVSGRIDEGTDALRPLLRDLALRLPSTPRASMLRTSGRLAQIALRRGRWVARAESDVPREDLTRIDLCYSAARGLLAVDTVRGAYLPCVGLLLALRAGEPKRIGRCLSAVGGGVLAPLPRRLSRWGERMLDEARRIARDQADAYLTGAIEVVTGQRCVVRGDWRGAVEHSAEGIRILEMSGRAVRWERNNAHTGLLRGLEELGRFREAAAHVAALREQAQSAGDLYGEMTAALFSGITDLAADQPKLARERIRDVLARWSQRGFHLQHFYALRVEMYADLYEGEPERAWRRLSEAWPSVKRSVLLRVPVTRIDLLLLRSRTALALAKQDPARASHFVPKVTADAHRLQREGRSDARGHAALLRAGVAAMAGRTESAVDQLDTAIREYERAGSLLQRACAQMCCAELLGDGQGRPLDDFREISHEAGVSDPERWLRLQAAGLGSSYRVVCVK